jgi:two-component system sensor histidine kinase VicK
LSKELDEARSKAAKEAAEWRTLDKLHSLVQERTNRYVLQLAETKQYLEEYVAVLTAMLDSIGDGLIVCDAEGNLALINEAAEKLVGGDIPSKVGSPWPNDDFGLFYEDGVTHIREEDKPMRRALAGLEVETVFFGRTSKQPEGGWFRVHATPVCDKAGVLHGAVAVFQDITEARKAAKEREAVYALVTHDLKNHLGGASRLIRALIEGRFGPLNNEQLELLTLIEEDSKRHFRMTNNLVEILRYDMRNGVLRFEDASMNGIISKCVSEAQHSAQIAEVKLEVECQNDLPEVFVDVEAMNHIITNLIGNAIKFTPKGGRIKLTTRQVEQEVCVTVSDSGPGIPDEEMSHLFSDVITSATQYPFLSGR